MPDLGLKVSTGKVVDFRSKEYLLQHPEEESVPLIYPVHMENGFIKWPRLDSRKPNALKLTDKTQSLLLPEGNYVVVRRFSSKEESKRIVAAVYEPDRVESNKVAFENHLNVFHQHEQGMKGILAKGLSIYLNSSLVDIYFRQFNGHTQVNATDLRALRYPARNVLESWGDKVGDKLPSQEEIDRIIEMELIRMSKFDSPDPIQIKSRIEEAKSILVMLGLPRAQQNDRSAMTLLALLNLKPTEPWTSASSPMLRTVEIMGFIKDNYGLTYAANTRETIRRQTLHQFIQASLVVENPDEPARPKNSPKWCYQISDQALSLLQKFETDLWESNLKQYLEEVGTLKEKYARRQKMEQIPVQVSPGVEIKLSPDKHSELMKAVIDDFGPRFAPGGNLVYVGDTGDKWGYFDQELLQKLGVSVDLHGKMPDVIIFHESRNWLLLIEAVTSHGPVDPKRRIELDELFSQVTAGLVYVTAFHTRSELNKHLAQISWATEVWIAESPTHLIHFDGERFLGPYDENID